LGKTVIYVTIKILSVKLYKDPSIIFVARHFTRILWHSNN